ncbi:DUF3352 domain-containing protein [Nocardioides sp.]|uniref:DUF3352 domain-containing protein n=1 Tax=Nocardioides sp. TaxID=35761 RepID=UPI00261B3BC3|nr:DUF3352 domain-containing protein [Nocardioides sp.]
MSAKGWIIGSSAAVVAVGAGAATWAAVSFFSSGPDAGEALPASTVAYVSLDLNPSGKQKIAALKLANKFPSLRKELGLNSTDDVRRKVVEELTKGTSCSLDYAKDVEPWIGSTVALAVVDKTDPKPVVALEVKEAAKASSEGQALADCVSKAHDQVAFAVSGSWMVFAENDDTVHQVMDEAAKHSLADDADFKKWTSETGDPGILTAYAAPAAPEALANYIGTMAKGLAGYSLGTADGALPPTEVVPSMCPGQSTTDLKDQADALASGAYKDFKGAAATVRFGGSGMELVMAGAPGGADAGTPSAGVSDLPAKVDLAVGLGMGKSFLTSVMDSLTASCPEQKTKLYESISRATGLNAPADLEALTSQSAQLVLGSGFRFDTMFGGGDSSDGVPLALRVKGDPATLMPIAQKLTATLKKQLGAEMLSMMGLDDVLTPVQGKDSVTVGLSAAFTQQVAQGGGGLGKDKDFTQAVPEADKAGRVLYLSHHGLQQFFSSSSDFEGSASSDGSSSESSSSSDSADTDHLQSAGLSSWLDGSISRGRLLITVK